MLKSSAWIAEQALRQIGVLSPLDTAALPEEFSIALNRLAMLIDELVETEQLQFFRPANQTIDLVADQTTAYDINGLLDTDLVFVTQVFLVSPTGSRTEIVPLRREVFDAEITDPDQAGSPEYCYIETDGAPTIQLYPTISLDGYKILLSGFKPSEDITVQEGNTEHGFTSGWQLGLTYLLAADIGSGPVTTIKLDERREFTAKGETKLRKLLARQNNEQVRRPRTTAMRTF